MTIEQRHAIAAAWAAADQAESLLTEAREQLRALAGGLPVATEQASNLGRLAAGCKRAAVILDAMLVAAGEPAAV